MGTESAVSKSICRFLRASQRIPERKRRKEKEGSKQSDGETYPKDIPSPAKMDRGKAIVQSSGVDKHKDVDVDEEYFDEGDNDMVGTISIIPTEYLGECEGNPDQENEEAFSFIRIEDEPGVFLRPTEKQMSHLRPLHIVAIVNGYKINKVLIDGGAAISLLPQRMLGKVGKHVSELVPTNIAVTDFSCYLTSEGLSVKLRYPDMPYEPTVNDMSRTANLIAEAHCSENKSCEDSIKDQVSTLSHDSCEHPSLFRFISLDLLKLLFDFLSLSVNRDKLLDKEMLLLLSCNQRSSQGGPILAYSSELFLN
ncbi:hypothetical protein Ahy_B04g072647 [Arachis hypogaea]|uniref:Aspartic peptidase DDI1-type domain-containing protein n=1 Tax=Arachis hypogaea TaxID=3818 RepID=A0A444ZNE6_ARAHY|nr:hypothetical protein Ahy_B04g072647 [Arachis hypogaea]